MMLPLARSLLVPPNLRRGLTLVEVLVSVAVLGVIVAVASPSLTDMMERRRIVAAAGELAGIVNFAKSEANAVGDTLILHLEAMPGDQHSSCARLVTQSQFDLCRCDTPAGMACTKGSSKLLREFLLPNSTGVSFAANGGMPGMGEQVAFERNTLQPTLQDFAITVTGKNTGAKLNVEYNAVGRVRTCSPDSSISGFPKC